MTIITDKYNRRDANFFTNHNLMAKKRKMYLYKRSGLLDSRNEATTTDGNERTTPSETKTTTTEVTTTSQQLPTTTTTSSNTLTFPSQLLSKNTTYNSLRVSFGHESTEVLQQLQPPQQQQQTHYQHQQQYHHHHCSHCHLSEDCELHPKALRICMRNSTTSSPPPPLNFNTSNQKHQQPAPPVENCHQPSCSCTNNCHSNCRCCSGRLAGAAAETPETFGKQQPWSPSMNSYIKLSTKSDDTDFDQGSKEGQSRQCHKLNSKSCSCLAATTPMTCTTTHNNYNSTPSNNRCCCYCCCCCHRFHYLKTSKGRIEEAAAAIIEPQYSKANIELNSSNIKSSSTSCFSSTTCLLLPPVSSTIKAVSLGKKQNLRRRTSQTSSLGPVGHDRRLQGYLSQKLQKIYMIFKILLALIPTSSRSIYPSPSASHETPADFAYPQNFSQRRTIFNAYPYLSQDQQSQQQEQMLQHQQSSGQHDPPYHQQLQQQRRRSSSASSVRLKSSHLLSNPVSNLNTLLMSLSLISLVFLSASQVTASATAETPLESAIKTTLRRSAENSLTAMEPPRTEVRLGRKETVCKSLDIRNTPDQMSQLTNCTVIEGFLLINLINAKSPEDYNETFPMLTEVTDYIIIYQVYHLRSLGQIFPNLSIIRGRTNFEGYALLIYVNPHLEELALPKLTMIGSGIRIEKNVMLCFVNTIDWTQIVRSNTTEVYMAKNRDPVECPSCPGGEWDGSVAPNEFVCQPHHGRRNCWNSKLCQTICPERCRHNCADEHTCCNERCIGGCSKDNVNECRICNKFSVNQTTCVDQCPEGLLNFMDRRCLPAEECLRLGSIFEDNSSSNLVPFRTNCTTKCPDKYVKENFTCVPCNGECIKKCQGSLIDGAARAKEYTGCHYIEGSLTLIIKRASQINAELRQGLKSIRTISGYLKVQGTFGMINLHFFESLQTIKGETLFEDKYAFYVLENTDLNSLWNESQTVQIENGTVYFHFNPKLCTDKIKTLLPMLNGNRTKFDENEVSEDSNGSKGSCNSTSLTVEVFRLDSLIAIVNITTPMKYEDERTFIGYQFLHMEDPYGNATEYGFRPCDDSWIVSEPTKSTQYVFSSLRPFTRYAFYVKTMTISTQRINGQSKIKHFTTKSSQPSRINHLHAYANSSSDIVLRWLPPANPNGKLIKYKIRATYDERVHHMESRNYCKDPLKVGSKIEKPIPTIIAEKPKAPQDCKCNKGQQGPDFNDESIDANIHASIELENALQNFVYVKKQSSKVGNSSLADAPNKTEAIRNRRDVIGPEPKDSFILRHIRQTRGLDAAPDLGAAVKRHDVNETRMDSTGQYYEVFVSWVNATTYDFTFTKLKHFSWYMLEIEACREPEIGNKASDCSEGVKYYERTLKLNDVDKVESLWARPESTNSSRTNIRLFWKQPKKPNGAVVSYTIFYVLKTRDEFEEKKCVTEVDYINSDYEHNGYVISDLQSGNYSIRIKTNSLAGEGLVSETISVYIPPITLAPGIIAGIAVGSIVLILLIAAVVYLLLRRRILATPTDLKLFPAMNPHYISLQYIPDEWEVARENVIQLNSLGQGSFGMVYEGILKSSEDDTPCAIKTVNNNATDRERMSFLNEACVMKQFDTYHVVHLLGVCSRGQPALVIMELMKNGDLKSYLRAHRPDGRDETAAMNLMSRGGMSSQPPPLSRIYQMAIEIADGMAYLAAKKFVHRDLAARNCMVAADLTVKIGDFGMTRDIYENDYYRKGTKGLLPVRWMPPESLRDGVYSTSSDVFSYGVVLWEMATLASQPYQGLGNDQVLRYVIDGGVMERPENCPDKLYSLMQKCWHHRPTARPTFMEIIRYLYDLADPHFREVSFYNSEEGQHILAKEIADRNQRSGDVFDDPENDMEDVTTPLRLEEYSNYKLTMDNNSSMGHRGDSSMVMDDDVPPSPYSMGSPMVVSSTPDEQSRGSYSVSRILHPNSHLLNSAPSTSAGLRKLGSSSGTSHHQLTHPHTHPHHRNLYQPTRFSQQQQQQNSRQHRDSEEIDAYVQPDFEHADEIKRDSDEQGYEIYDPSPNYSEHVPVGGDDDEDDFGIHSTAGQNLLVRPKGRQKQPTIMPLSTSMPDDVIAQQAASSLHPSTASAASSIASSSKAGNGKYPSLRAVADSARSRVMNIRIFHKRSGSNASHKSTNSNPNSSTGVGGSINNLARTGRGKSMSGQNLGTIESGGSGSASSYGANPRHFSTSSGTSTSDNPHYRRLDDSVGDNSIIGAETTSRIRPRLHSASAFMMGSSQPTYKMLDESLNTTGASLNAGENPNYEIMQPGGGGVPPPPAPVLMNEAGSSYVMMNEPAQKKATTDIQSVMNISDEANYQLMSPLIPTNATTTTTPTTTATMPTVLALEPPPAAAVMAAASAVPLSTLSSSSSTNSTSSSHDDDADEDDMPPTTDIQLQDLSLRRRSSNDHTTKIKDRSRSQSSSSGKSGTNTASSSITPTPTSQQQQPTTKAPTTTSTAPSSTFSRKEQWFKEQQQTPQPPPNGFVGREEA